MTISKGDLIAAVREHAVANYEKDGSDFLVECWTDEDIANAITGAKSKTATIAALTLTSASPAPEHFWRYGVRHLTNGSRPASGAPLGSSGEGHWAAMRTKLPLATPALQSPP
jgi:hypothetical protein